MRTEAGRALLDELMESPLDGARYARHVVELRLPAIEEQAAEAALRGPLLTQAIKRAEAAEDALAELPMSPQKEKAMTTETRFVHQGPVEERDGAHVHRGVVVVTGPVDEEACPLCRPPDKASLDAFGDRVAAARSECAHEGTPWCIVHKRLWVGPFDRCEGWTR